MSGNKDDDCKHSYHRENAFYFKKQKAMFDKSQLQHRSKYLSKILRHHPESIRLELDGGGWADVSKLLANMARYGQKFTPPFDRATLDYIVDNSDKKRYTFSEDGMCIRANQGHSVPVELGYEPQQPPEWLYHGTAHKNVVSIKKSGLIRVNRHHVHLSTDRETALRVGGRHGSPVSLTIRAGDLFRTGHVFYCTPNGVWLTDTVPSAFIEFKE